MKGEKIIRASWTGTAVLLVTSREMLIPSTVFATAPPPASASSATRRERSAVDCALARSSAIVESICDTNESTSSPMPARTSVRLDISLIEAFISVVDDDVFSTDWKR